MEYRDEASLPKGLTLLPRNGHGPRYIDGATQASERHMLVGCQVIVRTYAGLCPVDDFTGKVTSNNPSSPYIAVDGLQYRKYEIFTHTAIAPDPTVGMGATLCYPQDRHPYVIVAVGATGKTVQVLPLKTEGLKPTGKCNGFPVFDHKIEGDEIGKRMDGMAIRKTAHLRKDGRFYLGGTPLAIGSAQYYRNYAE